MSAVVTVASVVVVVGLVLLVARKVVGFLGTVAVAIVGFGVLAVLVSALFGVGDGLVPEGLSGVGPGRKGHVPLDVGLGQMVGFNGYRRGMKKGRCSGEY